MIRTAVLLLAADTFITTAGIALKLNDTESFGRR